MTTRIEAVLFDLGGVVIEVDFECAAHYWSQASGVPAHALKSNFELGPVYEQHERGEIDAAAYFDNVQNMLGLELPYHQMLQGWNSILGREIDGIRAVLEALKQRTRICAFSNTNVVHQDHWEDKYADALVHFETVYTSTELGLRKPESEAFIEVCSRMDVLPETTLFFDDSEHNIDGARAVGMPAVLVRSMDDVASALAQYELLP